MGIRSYVDVDGTRWTTELFDDVSAELVFIDHVHHELHNGDRFIATDFNAMALNSTRYYKLVTGAVRVHFLCKVNTSSEVLMSILTGSTVTVAGTAMPFRNRNQNSSASALSVATSGSTVTVDGTPLIQVVIGTARGFGDLRGEDEFLLAPNTVYVVKLDTNQGGAKADVSVNFDIYEE